MEDIINRISVPPFPSGTDISSAEICFLEKRLPSPWWKSKPLFFGYPVGFRKELSSTELAPLRKIFSIRDMFLGHQKREGIPEIGLRINLSNGQCLNVLISTKSCWMSVITRLGKNFLPMDRHVAFLIKEATRSINTPPSTLRASVFEKAFPHLKISLKSA